MRWATLTQRYSPLGALALVQVLVIVLAPSVPVERGAVGAFGRPLADGEEALSGEAAGAAGEARLTEGQAAGERSGSATAGSRAGAKAGPGGIAAAPGDRSHCKGMSQFDGITLPPPCVPKWTGGNNGGATYMGVTPTSVKVVRYDQMDDPFLQGLMKEIDLAATDAQEEAFMQAAEKFINQRFELYGRKIEFKTFKSKCKPLPPEPTCVRPEMAQLVETEKPFFVIWNSPIASAGYDELSARRVLNAGGWQFSDRFHTDRRPYHWDVFMSGTRTVQHLAEYWCKRLAGRPPRFAGPAAGKFDASAARVLGVVTADDPANQQVLKDFEDLVRGCGGGVRETFSFQQNPDTAAEQVNTGLDTMIEAKVSTLVCLCDAATPYFIFGGADGKSYHPEHLLPGTGLMDFDPAGRLYDGWTQWKKSAARPAGGFGIAALPEFEAYASNDATRVWQGAGNAGSPHNLAILDWFYYDMVATMIQMAGPALTPATVEQGAFAAGQYGGGKTVSGVPISKVGFAPGDYTWFSDVREVAWSSTTVSRLDGKRGSYVSLGGGRRYERGQWPAGEPDPASAPG
ncbi:MAG TPA: hypothetical protein VNE62_08335 [Actinomycetota bacterium]|nr:hypothetical protein [Actinomycetota bacterium]